jgi:hypothetical protein
MFAQALANRLARAGWAIVAIVFLLALTTAPLGGGFPRSTFDTDLRAFYIAGFACLIAAAVVWLIGRAQGARERLVEARA